MVVQLNFLRKMTKIEDKIIEYGDYYHKTTVSNLIPKTLPKTPKSKEGLFWINHNKKYELVPNKSIVVTSREEYNILKNEKRLREEVNELVVENPRYVYSKILDDLYGHLINFYDVKLVDNSWNNRIGFNVYYGKDVTVGKNVNIGNNVTIYGNVIIGDDVTIGDNTIIGTCGLGFERLSDGTLFKFPQMGGVKIGDGVEIGTHCDIKRGTLGDTIISKGCKIGSYNNIGHNTFMGENCLITVKCILCGSSKLGENVYMGTQSSVKENIIIPNRTTIGGMSFVTKNFKEEGKTLIGVPAKII